MNFSLSLSKTFLIICSLIALYQARLNAQEITVYDDDFWNATMESVYEDPNSIINIQTLTTSFKEKNDIKNFVLANAYLTSVFANKINKETVNQAEKSLALAKQHRHIQSEIITLNAITEYYLTKREFEKALTFAKRSFEASKSLSNQYIYVHSLSNLSKVYYYKGQFDHSLELQLEALTLYHELSSSGLKSIGLYIGLADIKLAAIHHIIANINFTLNKPEEAIYYYKKSLVGFNAKKDSLGKVYVLAGIGTSYVFLEEFDSAFNYLDQARKVALTANNMDASLMVECRLGYVNLKKKNFQKALVHYQNALKLLSDENNEQWHQEVYFGFADLYHLTNEPKKSLEHLKILKKTIEKSNSNINWRRYYKLSYLNYEKMGLFQQAFEMHKAYLETIEIANKNEHNKTLQELQVKFNTEQARKDNELLTRESISNKEKIEQANQTKKLMIIIISLSAIVIVGGGISFYQYYKSRQRYKIQSLKDELTGLPNRRAIMKMLSKHYEHAKKDNKVCSIAICDIDFFKKVNDTFGHDVGDKVLIDFSTNISDSLRELDQIGRIGGEEFLLIFPGLKPEDFPPIFKKLQEASLNVCPTGLPKNYDITFSMGVVGFDGGKLTVEDIMKKADMLLYEAKNNGRNQYML